MGILKLLFIVVLIGFVGGNITRLQLNPTVAITLLDMAVAVFILYWFGWRAIQHKKVAYTLTKPLLIFVAIAVGSLIANSIWLHERVVVAALYLVRWSMYACIYMAVQDFDVSFREQLKRMLLWVGIAFVLFGYLQYFFYNSLRNLFYLGWDEHMYRLFSTFLDPNFTGAFLALFSILVLDNLLQQKRKQWLLLLLYGITVVALILTFSRTGLIMLLIGTACLLVLRHKSKWIGGMVVLAVVLFVGLSLNFSNESMNLLRTFSSIERIKTLQRTVVIIQRYPLLGVGYDAYRYAQMEVGIIKNEPQFPSHADAGTDNSFLLLLATTGIIGTIAYAYLTKRIVMVGWRKNKEGLSVVLLSSLTALAVGSLFNNLLFYPFIMVWMWILIGLTDCR